MRWTDESGRTYGEEPYGGAGYAYAPGHEGDGAHTDTATLPWAAAHQAPSDPYPVPFVPEPDWGTAPAWETEPDRDTAPDSPASEPVRPVFVDASGRRQRHVLRAARLLMIPAGGYVVLLVSTLLGGPSVSAPFVPQPDATHPATARVTSSDAPSGTGRAAEHANPGPTTHRTASGRTAAQAAPATGPAAAPTRATSAIPARPRTSKGRALGSSHKPVK
ncbi:hypothetical protein ACWCQS_16365 [Streptomyces sp. NPDC002076]